LTFKGVKYKQQSAAFLNQVLSFNPIRKEDYEWSMVPKNPVTLDRWRTGFCILWAGKEEAMADKAMEWKLRTVISNMHLNKIQIVEGRLVDG